MVVRDGIVLCEVYLQCTVVVVGGSFLAVSPAAAAPDQSCRCDVCRVVDAVQLTDASPSLSAGKVGRSEAQSQSRETLK